MSLRLGLFPDISRPFPVLTKKKAGLIISTTGFFGGIYFGNFASSESGRFFGDILVNASLGGLTYTYHEKEESFSVVSYVGNIASSILNIFASGGINALTSEAGKLSKLSEEMKEIVNTAGQVLGDATVNVATTSAAYRYTKGRWPNAKSLKKQFVSNVVGRGTGFFAKKITVNVFQTVTTNFYIRNNFTYVAFNILRRTTVGVVSSVGSSVGQRVIINQMSNKSLSEDVLQESLQAGLIGGLTSLSFGTAEGIKKFQTLKKVHLYFNEIKKIGGERYKNAELIEGLARFGVGTVDLVRMILEFYKLQNFSDGIIRMIFKEEYSNSEDFFLKIELQLQELIEHNEGIKEKIKLCFKESENNVAKAEKTILQFKDTPSLKTVFPSFEETNEALRRNLEPEPLLVVQPSVQVECTEVEKRAMEELIDHVVFVHAFNMDGAPEEIQNRIIAAGEIEGWLVYIKFLMAPNGTIGDHLSVEKREFIGELGLRPQMHWSWNQLVQPNSGGNWEGAKIAILEPWSTFERSNDQKPFGIAPYDTLIKGPHTLSKDSILLIPKLIEKHVRDYLIGFVGRIVTYDDSGQNLRHAIMETLHNHYPKTWHMCNSAGDLVGYKGVYTYSGFDNRIYIRTSDNRVTELLRNGREPRCDAMRGFKKSKRFIGLHSEFITDQQIEKNEYFNKLRGFTTKNELVKDDKEHLFAGSVKGLGNDTIKNLGVLKAFNLFLLMKSEIPSESGLSENVRYYLKVAMYADLVSLYYQMHPMGKFDLCFLDVKMIFGENLDYLEKLLNNIKTDKEIVKSFEAYCSWLKQSMNNIRTAKQKTLRFFEIKLEDRLLDITFAKEEWEKIEVPNSIKFDLGKDYISSPQLHSYIDKVIRSLPNNSLEMLHLGLSLQQKMKNAADPKEEYRFNVLESILQWSLQQHIYSTLAVGNGDIDSITPLMKALSKHDEWIKNHHLKTVDHMKVIGDCLFDNIVVQLGNPVSSQQLRVDVVDYMIKNRARFEQSLNYEKDNTLGFNAGELRIFNNFDEYTALMKTPRIWATELEIHALAEMLQRPIVLLTLGFNPKIYNEKDPNPPLFLEHKNKNHFVSCISDGQATLSEIFEKISKESHY